jgi:pyruvate formate lyase activating enzyme
MPPSDGASIDLVVGGLVPLTTVDYPGQLAAVIFCQGCPWRCTYCHNPHLWPAQASDKHAWPQVAAFLARRRGLLDAVVFSGGEPTAQQALPEAIAYLRDLGFRVGLHTAGIYPARLGKILPLLDWIALDVKAPFVHYDALTHARGSGKRTRASLHLVLESGKPYEIRTTAHPALLPRQQLLDLAHDLSTLGVRHYAVQAVRPHGCATDLPDNPNGIDTPYLDDALRREMRGLFSTFVVRDTD